MFDFMMTDEQKRLRDEARAFTKWVPRQLILDMDAEKVQFPREYLQEAGRRNLLGIRLPREYGGRGLTWVDDAIVAEEIGVASYSLACLWGVGADIVCEAIIEFGCEELKQQVVVPLLKGETFAAECLTEPRGGSDFFGATTVAKKDGDDWLITGQKRFIVGAEGADWFLVYAVTDPSAPAHKRMTAFMVPRTSGVETKYIYGLMGVRGGGAGRLILKDVRVPERYALGGINGGFEVFKRMMIPERLGTAAMTIGSVRPAIEIATRYTSKRKAFGFPIQMFQAVGFKVADCAMMLDAARSMVYTTCRAVDSGTVHPGRVRRMVSQSKKFVTEAAWEIANKCMQVVGGIGYTNVYPLERIVRDIRLSMIWVGSNEIMQLIIQNEWYKEYFKTLSKEDVRDVESDALNAHEEEEKVYE
ncbi:MAG: acyl-CoA dehydrogenase family protein [Pseudomonadota bacterium]|jgi:butyryl-CoA dehydrogenase|uniref:Acyl-CoA dehydrogenase n=1 Tax=anaerobic digester metagenome TaxID=1263854 RepID=A0A485LYS6_9ZZZZ|nr:acyl-CoA dehydrogenase family protein [Pseudomonadota bacterium]HON37542.1 acyl-CoA dehydrogenase family protein [Deltaproteobacteria bacterium]HRS55050.1 acyl-CoA dehydrogenase family protein [Desulfomonilia bacterium]HPD20767.1 acyl-CoA dehydrogenase family protein [Deltaproteobacteria bacterium]HPX18567.1 acyl-CoA dehydrogenase family protein [Deltaproteobacteria bacterium]